MRSLSRRTSLVMGAAGVLLVSACSANDSIVEPDLNAPVMALTPPPPPLSRDDFLGPEGDFIQFDCAYYERLPADEATPRQVNRIVPLTADPRLLVAKPGSYAMLQLKQAAFRADGPNATVPAGTFVQQRDGNMSGRGIIVLDVSEPDYILVPLRADMSEATGDLMMEGVDLTTNEPYRAFSVSVPVTRLDGTEDIETCGTSGWTIRTTAAVISFRY